MKFLEWIKRKFISSILSRKLLPSILLSIGVVFVTQTDDIVYNFKTIRETWWNLLIPVLVILVFFVFFLFVHAQKYLNDFIISTGKSPANLIYFLNKYVMHRLKSKPDYLLKSFIKEVKPIFEKVSNKLELVDRKSLYPLVGIIEIDAIEKLIEKARKELENRMNGENKEKEELQKKINKTLNGDPFNIMDITSEHYNNKYVTKIIPILENVVVASYKEALKYIAKELSRIINQYIVKLDGKKTFSKNGECEKFIESLKLDIEFYQDKTKARLGYPLFSYLYKHILLPKKFRKGLPIILSECKNFTEFLKSACEYFLVTNRGPNWNDCKRDLISILSKTRNELDNLDKEIKKANKSLKKKFARFIEKLKEVIYTDFYIYGDSSTVRAFFEYLLEKKGIDKADVSIILIKTENKATILNEEVKMQNFLIEKGFMRHKVLSTDEVLSMKFPKSKKAMFLLGFELINEVNQSLHHYGAGNIIEQMITNLKNNNPGNRVEVTLIGQSYKIIDFNLSESEVYTTNSFLDSQYVDYILTDKGLRDISKNNI